MTLWPFSSKSSNVAESDIATVNRHLLGFTVLGTLVVIAVWWDRFTVALLWSYASGAVGFILGFIFGFPRTVAQPAGAPPPAASSSTTPPATGAASTPDSPAARLAVNTNLEQVSDWITKTIVGVGLVEFKQIPPNFRALAAYAGGTVGRPYTGSSADEAAAALIAYFAVLGFLSGYLITRMYFQAAFGRGDRALDEAAQVVQGTLVSASIGSFKPEGSDTTKISDVVAAAAERLKALTLEGARARGISTAAIAKANLVSGHAEQAAAAYPDAIARDPLNSQLRFEYATALQRIGRPAPEVIAVLRDARTVELQKPNPDVRRNVYESLTYLYLYQAEPEGFTQAIRYGAMYTSDASSLPSPTIWVNLAAAYGQQARWYQRHPEVADDPARAQARDATLDAIRHAVRLDPSTRDFLATLLAPSDQQKAAGEDDLSVFRNDDEFRQLLGLSKSAAS